MKTDQYGQVYFTENELFEAIYSGDVESLEQILLEDKSIVDQFNKSTTLNYYPKYQLNSNPNFDLEPKEFDRINQNNWFMPKNYGEDIVDYLFGLCNTEEEILRVNQELELYKKYDLINVLKYLKYLVEIMRENKIVWGVGRGSCVSSYCLFLLGVHKIDSLKYNLPINEFFKIE